MAALLLLTGCWDAREVNELSLATMIILDKLGDEYTFTLEFPTITPIGESGSSASKCVYLKAIGKTFPEVRDDLENQLEKPLYLGTFQTLMVTERAARDDMAEYMLRMRQDPSYRQRVIMVVTRDEPEAFTHREDKTASGGGGNIDDLLTTIAHGGRSYYKTTAAYMEDILNKRGFVIHCIDLKDKKIDLAGYCVFRDAKCVGFIPTEESRGLIWLVADNPIWHYRVPFENGFATVEVRLDKRKIVPSYENGSIRLILQVDLDAQVQYVGLDGLFPLNKTALNEIKTQVDGMIHQELQSTVDRSQKEFQSDYLLFGEAFRIAYPDVFDKMDWGQEYLNAQIDVQTKVDLRVSPRMDLGPS
jgi:Ger(x)C family germination protein